MMLKGSVIAKRKVHLVHCLVVVQESVICFNLYGVEKQYTLYSDLHLKICNFLVMT